MFPLLVALVSAMGASPRLPALHVATEADPGLKCPVNAALVSALALRLPSVRLASGKLEAEDLTAKLSPDLDAWRFEVRRASGAIAMSRVLAAQADCAQIADTAALILERFLAEIDWRGRPVGIDPLQPEAKPHHEKVAPVKPHAAPPKAEPAREPEPLASPKGERAPEPAARAEPRPAPAETPPIERPRPEPREERSPALGSSGSSSGVEIVPGASGFTGTDEQIGRTHSVAPAPEPEPPPVVAQAAAPSAPAVASEQTAPPPQLRAEGPIVPRRKILSRPSFSAGGGGWLGLPTDLTASFSLEVAATLLERVRLSLVLVASSLTGGPIADNRGSILLQSFSGFLTGTLCSSDRFSACGGLAAGAHVTRAAVSTTDSRQHLYRTGSDALAVPAAGLYGRAAFVLIGGLELSLDLAGLVPFGTGSFTIEGFPSPYTTPPVELIAGLRLGWTFF